MTLNQTVLVVIALVAVIAVTVGFAGSVVLLRRSIDAMRAESRDHMRKCQASATADTAYRLLLADTLRHHGIVVPLDVAAIPVAPLSPHPDPLPGSPPGGAPNSSL